MSDCGVCLSGYEGEPMEMLAEKVVTARKPATCCECNRAIGIGEKYQYAKGLCEGEFSVYRTCAVCLEIRDAFNCGNGYVFCGLWEDLEYSFDEINDGCFARLKTVEAKRYLRERWMLWKGLPAH